MGATHRRGMRSEQPSKRRASARAAAWCTVSPYRSMNFTRPTTELYAGLTSMIFNSFPVTTGQEVGLDLAVAEARQHPAVLSRLALQSRLLLPEIQLLNDDGLADLPCVLHHAGHRVADESLSLVSILAVGDQRHPPGVQVVAAGVGIRHSEVVGVQGPRRRRRAFCP